MEQVESWRDHPVYGAMVQASTLGSVRQFLWAKEAKCRSKQMFANAYQVLPVRKHKSGYLVVNLLSPVPKSSVKVHRIVAECFHGVRPEGMDTAHRDGCKSNNAPSNLVYCTRKLNSSHKMFHVEGQQKTWTTCPAIERCRVDRSRSSRRKLRTCRECGRSYWKPDSRSFCSQKCMTQMRRRIGARLSTEMVQEIRARSASGESQRGLARLYGVSSTTVSRIVRGVDWK